MQRFYLFPVLTFIGIFAVNLNNKFCMAVCTKHLSVHVGFRNSGAQRSQPENPDQLNKLDLIQALKDSNNLYRSEAEKIVTLFFDQMAEALTQGDRVEIRGLCSFSIKKYKGYTGRNPRTGEKVKISSKKLPYFKVGKVLKERVDG